MTTPTSKRRQRSFTTPETLATHPIVLLFDRPDIQRIMHENGETGLRFSELQYLLCKSSPNIKMRRECSRQRKCKDCRKHEKCRTWRYERLSAVKDAVAELYDRRSNMADDLDRLVDKNYLIHLRWGYYTRGERKSEREGPFASSTRRAALLRTLERKFKDQVHLVDKGRFVLIGNSWVDEAAGARVISLARELDEELVKLTLRLRVSRLADEFEKHIAIEMNAEARVKLQDYLLKHIKTRLSLLGLREREFSNDLARIRHLNLGVSPKERSEIMNKIEQERWMLDEVEVIVSRFDWMPRKVGWPGAALMQLATEQLFDVEAEGLSEPAKGVIRPFLRSVFNGNGVAVSSRAMVSRYDDSAWLVSDKGQTYLLEKKERTMKVSKLRQGTKPDLKWILRAKALLDRNSAFEEEFANSSLNLRVDIGEEVPIVVIGATERPKVPRLKRLPVI